PQPTMALRDTDTTRDSSVRILSAEQRARVIEPILANEGQHRPFDMLVSRACDGAMVFDSNVDAMSGLIEDDSSLLSATLSHVARDLWAAMLPRPRSTRAFAALMPRSDVAVSHLTAEADAAPYRVIVRGATEC